MSGKQYATILLRNNTKCVFLETMVTIKYSTVSTYTKTGNGMQNCWILRLYVGLARLSHKAGQGLSATVARGFSMWLEKNWQ